MTEYLEFAKHFTQFFHGYRVGDPLSALGLYFNAFVLIPALAIASTCYVVKLVKEFFE